jgi:hypothetical protein
MNAVTPHWPGEKSMSVIDRPSSVEEHSCQWDWYTSAIRCDKRFTSTPVAKVTVLQQLLARVKSSPSSNTGCCVYFPVGMAINNSFSGRGSVTLCSRSNSRHPPKQTDIVHSELHIESILFNQIWTLPVPPHSAFSGQTQSLRSRKAEVSHSSVL